MKPGKMMVAAGLAMYGANCFVQPGQQPQAPPAAEVAQVKFQQQEAVTSEEAPQSSSSWEGLAVGVALGLAVGLAGAAAPAKAAGGWATTGIMMGNKLECNIHKGCTGEKLEKWAKDTLALEEKATTPPGGFSQKGARPSTGAGVYRKYGLDYASPMKGNGLDQPGSGLDGTYTINETRKHPWNGRFDWSGPDDDAKIKAMAEKLWLNKQGFSWQNSPYKWDKSLWDK